MLFKLSLLWLLGMVSLAFGEECDQVTFIAPHLEGLNNRRFKPVPDSSDSYISNNGEHLLYWTECSFDFGSYWIMIHKDKVYTDLCNAAMLRCGSDETGSAALLACNGKWQRRESRVYSEDAAITTTCDSASTGSASGATNDGSDCVEFVGGNGVDGVIFTKSAGLDFTSSDGELVLYEETCEEESFWVIAGSSARPEQDKCNKVDVRCRISGSSDLESCNGRWAFHEQDLVEDRMHHMVYPEVTTKDCSASSGVSGPFFASSDEASSTPSGSDSNGDGNSDSSANSGSTESGEDDESSTKSGSVSASTTIPCFRFDESFVDGLDFDAVDGSTHYVSNDGDYEVFEKECTMKINGLERFWVMFHKEAGNPEDCGQALLRCKIFESSSLESCDHRWAEKVNGKFTINDEIVTTSQC